MEALTGMQESMASAIRELNRGMLEPPRQDRSETGRFASILDEQSKNVGSALKEGIERVSALQMKSRDLLERMARGEPTEIHEVLVAREKAGVAFRMMLEMRNKLMDLWQQVSRLPV